MATQVTGELYYDLDGQLIEIKRQLRQSAGYPFDPRQLKVALQNAIEGKFGDVPKKEPGKQNSFLSIIATTKVGATKGKKTNACFTGSIYGYRDSDFDHWLGKNQPGADACAISTLVISKDWLFAEAARALPGVEQTTDTVRLARSVIACGYTLTPMQAEEMVEDTERGGGTGMLTNGYGNFFFVETGNEDDPVSVGCVIRDGRAWNAHLRRFAYGYRWHADGRLLVRNLDTSKL